MSAVLLAMAIASFACAVGGVWLIVDPKLNRHIWAAYVGHGLMAASVVNALICLAITAAQCPSCAF